MICSIEEALRQAGDGHVSRRIAQLVVLIWTSPFPEFDAGRYQHPLSPSELRELGRVDLASEVDAARAWGVDAYGWLPMTPGARR